MKSIYLISISSVIFGFIFALKPGWFTFLFGWQLLLLPLTTGMLLVLVQSEFKSCHFLPKLVKGALMTSFVFVFLWQLVVWRSNQSIFWPESLYTALFLFSIIIFGGLIGIVIRGISLLFQKK